MLQKALDLGRFFGRTQAMENAHTWNLECQKSLQVRFFENINNRITKMYFRLGENI
jgi:hypothetical protein